MDSSNKHRHALWQRYRNSSISLPFFISILLLLVLTISSLVAYTSPQAQASSNTLNFQGRLLTNTGGLVPDGTYNVEFNIYNVASGGSSLWTEDRLNTNTEGVTIRNGYFSVYLGELDAFGSLDWNQDLWLGMTIRGTGNCAWGACTPTDSEMTPRFELSSVPYAVQASRLATNTGSFTSTLGFTTPTANRTISLPDDSGTVCLTSGNCAGTGGNGDILDGGQAGAISIGTTDATTLSLLQNGSAALTVNTSQLLQFNAYNCSTFSNGGTLTTDASGNVICANDDGGGGGTGVDTIGALDGGTANANGASIVSTTLYLQSASATNPGLINTGAQTLAGNKTLTGNTIFQSAVDSTTALQVLDNDGGNPVFSVDTVNERVGIGTAAPTEALEIRQPSSGSVGLRISQSGSAYVDFQQTDGASLNDDFRISVTGTGGTGTFIFTNEGTLGISGDAGGVAVPDSSLEIFAKSGVDYLRVSTIEDAGGDVLVVQADGDTAFDTDTLFVNATSGRVAVGSTDTTNGEFTVSGDTSTRLISVDANVNSGVGLYIPGQNLTTGRGISISGSNSGEVSSMSGALIGVDPQLNYGNASTRTQSGNFLYLNRRNTVTNASGTFNTTGDLALLQSDNCIAATGTCTDSSNVLQVSQLFAGATGEVAQITNAGTGLSLRVNDDGTDTDSTPFVIDNQGRVGIGNVSPGYGFEFDVSDGRINLPNSTFVSFQNQTGTSQALLETRGYAGSSRKAIIVRDDANAATFQVSNSGTVIIEGNINVSDGSSNYASIDVAPTAGDYTYTIPDGGGNDTFCLVGLNNCVGAGSTSVGALDGGTLNANGGNISAGTLYLQSASATFPGLVTTGAQTFAGTKTFNSKINVSTGGGEAATFNPGTITGVGEAVEILGALNRSSTNSTYGSALSIATDIIPTSGQSNLSFIDINGTVNSTGAGIENGILIRPTITAANNYRAIAIFNNSGYGIYQSGASASNLFTGSTSFNGALRISDGSSNYGTIAVQSTAGDYTYTIPTTTADDTFCLSGLNNCAGSGDFVQNGNSFTATAVLGTNDAYGLSLETNGTTALTIDTSQNATFAGNLNVDNDLYVGAGASSTSCNTVSGWSAGCNVQIGNYQSNNTATSLAQINTDNTLVANPGSSSTASYYAQSNYVEVNGGANNISGSARSLNNAVYNNNTGTINFVGGITNQIYNTNGGTITDAYGTANTISNDNVVGNVVTNSIGTLNNLQNNYNTSTLFRGTVNSINTNFSGSITTAIGTDNIINLTSSGTIADAYGVRVQAATDTGAGSITRNAGISIAEQNAATNNTNLLIGTTTIPAGQFSIYNASTDANLFNGSLTVDAQITSGDAGTAGSLRISDGSSNYATLGVQALAGDYTVDIPTITANDEFCLLVLGNCTGSGTDDTTITVAPNDASAGVKAAADYVADGTSDEDEINSALTAAAGGKVILLAGTFVADATILIPNNTTLEGQGSGTVIQLADIDVAENLIQNTDTSTGTGIVIRDLLIDGRDNLNTAGIQTGISISGAGDTATGLEGVSINNVTVQNFRTKGISIANTENFEITDSIFDDNEDGIYLTTSSSDGLISGNKLINNENDGIQLQNATNVNVENNIIENNVRGIYADSVLTNSNISNNQINQNSGYGIYLNNNNVDNNNIVSNTLNDNGGATTNHAILVFNADNNSFNGNTITDTSCTTNCYAFWINAGADKTYLEGNRFSGSAANAATINDAGTGTIYAGQQTNTTTSTLSDVSDFRFRGSANSTTAFAVQNTAGASILNVDTTNNQLTSDGIIVAYGGILEAGNSSQAGSLVVSDGSSNTGTIVVAPTSGNYTYSIPTTTANDTFCLVTLANCGGSGAFTSSGGFTYLNTSTDFVGIGTSTPDAPLEVVSTTISEPRGVLSSQYTNNVNGAFFQGRKARGTPGTPLAITDGDFGTILANSFYDGNSWENTGFATFKSNGTVADGSVPTDFVLYTGSTNWGTERLRVTSVGNLEVDTDTLFVDATNNRVGIGTSTPSATLEVVGTIRNANYATLLDTVATSTSVDLNQTAAAGFLTVSPSAASSAFYNGLSGFTLSSSLNLTDSTLTGVSAQAEYQGTGTAADLRAFSSNIGSVNGTVTRGVGYYAPNPFAYSGGVITNNYGVLIADQTRGTNDYGIAIEGADTQALWIGSGANNTDAANGIAFGSSRDTNLYRSAANTLSTDDALSVGGALTVTSNINSQSGDIRTANNIRITNTGNLTNIGTIDANGLATFDGDIRVQDSDNTNYATIAVNNLANNYTVSIPTITANDTFCLLVLGNCAGGTGSDEFITVAANDSSAAEKAAADYVADGTSDQTEINSALTAASGGKVLLLAGTYVADGTILIPNNTTLEGVGEGTVVQLDVGVGSDNLIESTGSSKTGQTIRNLTLDGSLGTGGTQRGIYMSSVGSVSGDRPGSVTEDVIIRNFQSTGYYLNISDNNVIKDSWVHNNGSTGVYTISSDNNVIKDSWVHNNGSTGVYIRGDYTTIEGTDIYDNTGDGVYFYAGSDNILQNSEIYNNGDEGIESLSSSNMLITGNNIHDNTSAGFYINSYGDNVRITNNSFTGNSIGVDIINIDDVLIDSNYVASNTSHGIYLYYSDNTIVSNNRIHDNAGTGSDSGIEVSFYTNVGVKLINNYITDTAGTGYAIDINTNSRDIYLESNFYSGTGAETIRDNGANTIYASQQQAGQTLQSGSSILKANDTTVLTGSIDPIASTTLTGVGTLFLSELQVGDRIVVSGETRTVTAIASDLSLTVDVATTDTANDTTPDRLPAALIVKDSSNNIDLIIADNGNVGIGTSAPTSILDITDSSTGDVQITVTNTNGGGSAFAELQTVNDVGAYGAFGIGSSGTTADVWQSRAFLTSSTGSTGITLLTQGAGDDIRLFTGGQATSNERLRVTDGTTSVYNDLTIGDANAGAEYLTLDSNATDESGTVNGSMYYDTTLNKFRCRENGTWKDCIATSLGVTSSVTRLPEFDGGTIYADGSSNSGTLTSGYASGLSAGQGYKHNYYQWATTQSAAQDYNIVVQVPIPSDYTGSFGNVSFWHSDPDGATTNSEVTLTIKDQDETTCSNASYNGASAGVWEEETVSVSTCTYSAGDIITFDFNIKTTSGAGSLRLGEFKFEYTN